MLNHQIDIYAAPAPFLIVLGNGNWRVARELFPCTDGVGFIEPFAADADREPPSGVLPGNPFHVGDHVWELDYNARNMTLNHPHHHHHPAWRLRPSWLSAQHADAAAPGAH